MDVDVVATELQQFLQRQIADRNMSMREFADFIGVSHTTVNRALDPREDKTPSLEFLFKLAAATHTDVCELVRMVAPPELASRQKPSAFAVTLSERIERLPLQTRQIIDDFILAALLRSRNQMEQPDDTDER